MLQLSNNPLPDAYHVAQARERELYQQMHRLKPDGAQWIQDNYGISLGDFQQVAMQWVEAGKREGYEAMQPYVDHHQAKKKEYAELFAKQHGGNIADDVEF